MQLNIVFKDWLNSQKITDSVLEDFNVGGEECIVIPVYSLTGSFLYNKYRRSPLSDEKPKYWYDKGGKVALYAWHKAEDANTILITEGEKDCLVAWSQNIPAVTSTGGAMSFQSEWGELFKDKEVILCFDNDHVGGEGMVKTLSIIPHAKVMFIPDRPNIKDLSDYVSAGGDLRTLMQTAKHFKDIDHVKADRDERYANFQSAFFHDEYIKAHTKVINKQVANYKRTFDNDRVTNAKGYPIPKLLDFTQNKTLCPFHKEKTPSLTYYAKDNHCWCFGCGKRYDAIAIYMDKYKVGFIQAVDDLNKLS